VQRRRFITLLGSAAATSGVVWSLAARAQEPADRPRISFLTGLPAEDPEGHARLGAFEGGLAELGWRVGRNLDMDYRAAGRDAELFRKYAEEMAASRPQVLVASGAPALAALQKATRFLPIIFANATMDPTTGYLARLARPARNASGVINFETRIGWKWLELLKQLAPHVTRVGVVRSDSPIGIGHMVAVQSMAPQYGVELTALYDHDAREIERGIATFVRGPNHGLIVASQLGQIERERTIELAAQYRLPTVYGFRRYVEEGGLISYGPDQIEPYRKAAGLVDRILMGEKVVDLPVQAPGQYKTILNMKTAKTLGIDIPERVLARTDEMIEWSPHND
jgi:putative ABC transport system substrate-binding protein